MVLIEDQFDVFGNFPLLDANDELIRVSSARTVQWDEKSLRLCEDDYKIILHHLLASEVKVNPLEERLNPQNDNDKDGAREDEIRSKALKRKAGKNNDGGNGTDEENERQDERMLRRNRKHECGPSNQMCAENVHKPNPRCFSVNKTSNAGKDENIQGPLDAEKTKSFMLKTSINDARMGCIQISASEFREAVAAECSMAHKNAEENNLKEDDQGESDSDVEILEEDACVKRGTTNPFVSSKRFAKSMEDGTGRSNEHDGFRRRVVDVLKKPYDREEYKRHVEAIQAGSYLAHHPDVQKKLKKYRYNKEKRLTILRGFFFWLQNLTQEGAFKPWKDGACLAVQPSSQ